WRRGESGYVRGDGQAGRGGGKGYNSTLPMCGPPRAVRENESGSRFAKWSRVDWNTAGQGSARHGRRAARRSRDLPASARLGSRALRSLPLGGYGGARVAGGVERAPDEFAGARTGRSPQGV